MTIPPIGALGGIEVAPASALQEPSSVASSAGAPSAAGSEGSFSGALTKAIDSLEQAQTSAGSAASEVALGTTSDPESAVVKVQNAELEMEAASQIRTKVTEALNNLFQTQV